VGLSVGTFAIGGLIYAAWAPNLVARFGQVGLATWGGIVLGCSYLALALIPTWWLAPVVVTFVGLGFYMLHNTLQTNATQMSPDARGTAGGAFSAGVHPRASGRAAATA